MICPEKIISPFPLNISLITTFLSLKDIIFPVSDINVYKPKTYKKQQNCVFVLHGEEYKFSNYLPKSTPSYATHCLAIQICVQTIIS